MARKKPEHLKRLSKKTNRDLKRLNQQEIERRPNSRRPEIPQRGPKPGRKKRK